MSGSPAFKRLRFSNESERKEEEKNAREDELLETPTLPLSDDSLMEETPKVLIPLKNVRKDKLEMDFQTWEECRQHEYRLLKPLGEGAYGKVVKAISYKEQSFPVAIKMVYDILENPIVAFRILREINILRQLNHITIIHLYNVLEPIHKDTFDRLFLIFDYMDTDLGKLIRSPEYLPARSIQFIFYQILCGIKYLHSNYIIHRDLKPENVLINTDLKIKLCDFGLSRKIDGSTDLKIHSFLGEDFVLTKHVVTRYYRAPELLLKRKYSTQIDIWSAGCIFAELLMMELGNASNFKDRKPLFPGKSSSLSPKSANQLRDEGHKRKEEEDQLELIFNVIGTPDIEELHELESDVRDFCLKTRKRPAKNLKQEFFPISSDVEIQFLKKLIQFDPHKRPTAGQALEDLYLKNTREIYFDQFENSIITEGKKIKELEPFQGSQKEFRKAFLDEITLFPQNSHH